MIQVPLTIDDSFVLICPQCFDCWAKLQGSDTSHWWHRYVPCLQHTIAAAPYGAKLGGSLLESGIPLDALPVSTLSDELNLYLKETA